MSFLALIPWITVITLWVHGAASNAIIDGIHSDGGGLHGASMHGHSHADASMPSGRSAWDGNHVEWAAEDWISKEGQREQELLLLQLEPGSEDACQHGTGEGCAAASNVHEGRSFRGSITEGASRHSITHDGSAESTGREQEQQQQQQEQRARRHLSQQQGPVVTGIRPRIYIYALPDKFTSAEHEGNETEWVHHTESGYVGRKECGAAMAVQTE